MTDHFAKNIKGFTLIEILVVIVIIGIVSVVALPKYVSLKKEARTASLQQLQASVRKANDFMKMHSYLPGYSTRVVNGRDDLLDVDLDGDGNFEIRLKWGYLDNTDIEKRIDISSEFVIETRGYTDTYIGFDLNNSGNVRNDNCYFQYTQASSDSVGPVYQITDSGC